MYTTVSLFVAAVMATTVSAGYLNKGIFTAEQSHYNMTQLVSQMLGVSDNDVTSAVEQMLVDGMLSYMKQDDLCKGNKCSLCFDLPIVGDLCIEVESDKCEKCEVGSLHLMLTKKGHEVMCVTYSNEGPKICLLGHFCLQMTKIHITEGEICYSMEFNGKCVICNHCIKL